MRIEHVAFNVSDSIAVAEWYVKHFGMTVVRQAPPPTDTRFLADSEGRTVLELYNNRDAPVLDYAAQDPLMLHLAFKVEHAPEERDRLAAAGATLVREDSLPNGDMLIMMRDPWGLAVQLCQRGVPLVK